MNNRKHRETRHPDSQTHGLFLHLQILHITAISKIDILLSGEEMVCWSAKLTTVQVNLTKIRVKDNKNM